MDTITVSDPVYVPYEQIVADNQRLKPEDAIAVWGENGYVDYCVSPLYSHVLYNGKEYDLEPFKGKWVAIYVRVSTITARGLVKDDGFSIMFQLEKNIAWCIEKRFAFRIFSDAGLSGGLPTRDEALVQEMRNTNAESYRLGFEDALLSNMDGLSAQEIQGPRDYLEVALRQLRSGGKSKGVVLGESGVVSKDQNWPVIQNVFRKFNVRRKNEFRPALHILVSLFSQIHTIVITDYDRISRSMALSEVLRKKLLENLTMVYGTTEALEWATDREEYGAVMNALMPLWTTRKLRKIKFDVIRGLVTRLKARRPHSCIPWCFRRDEKGYIVWSEDDIGIKTVRRILELYRAQNVKNRHGIYGPHRIAKILNEEGWPAPEGPTFEEKNALYAENGVLSQIWSPSSVKNILANTLLFGVQVVFGREWPMCQPLITREEFEALQEVRTKRAEKVKSSKEHVGGYVSVKHTYSGLLRCVCGYRMGFQMPRKGTKESPRLFCAAPTARKLALNQALGHEFVHSGLREDWATDFLDALFGDTPEILLSAYGGGPAKGEITLQIESLQAEIARIDKDLADKQPEWKVKAKTIVLLQEVPETDVDRFGRALRGVLDNLSYDFMQRKREIKQRLTELQSDGLEFAIDDMQLPSTPEEWQDQWKTWEPSERNKRLACVIEDIRMEGENGGDRLVIRVKGNEDGIPPIPLTLIEYHANRTIKQFPDFRQWYLEATFPRKS